MNEIVELEYNKSQIEARLRAAIIGIRQRVTTPNVTGQIDRCLAYARMRCAENGEFYLPSPVSWKDRSASNNPVAIVLHEIKLALLRFWELCRTEQTTGLRNLLTTLEDYANMGWQNHEIRGSVAEGFRLVLSGRDKIPPPPPPAVACDRGGYVEKEVVKEAGPGTEEK